METAEMAKSTDSTKTTDSVQIKVPYPDSLERRLHITVGACHLRIAPAEEDQRETWITGRYYGRIEALPLEISSIGGNVTISQRQEWAEVGRLFEGAPTLELYVSRALPYSLAIETGASDSYLSLGGLPILDFALRQGAGKVAADFSAPNPEQMERFAVSAGASRIELHNLANANFAEMLVEGGAVAYELDFGGVLRRDAHVRLTSAMSSADISIPPSTAAKITTQLMIGGCNADERFVKREGGYWNEQAMAVNGVQPTLYAQVTLTMGSLNLRSK